MGPLLPCDSHVLSRACCGVEGCGGLRSLSLELQEASLGEVEESHFL